MTAPDPALPPLPAAARQALAALRQRGPRTLLGLVGPPGAGKSTLAAALCAECGDAAVVVPMDGYHLAQAELQRLDRAQRKGAPDTFDAAGYAALLRRLRAADEPVVYAPAFRRDLEEPVAGAIAVPAHTPLVITEGNYLLLQDDGWDGVAALLDEVWYVEVDPALRLARLLRRHQQFGRTEAQARAWVASTDEPNARRIEATRHRAHRVLHWGA